MGYFAENFDYVLEQIEAINEAYFGKTKEVYDIEKALHNLRAPYITKKDNFGGQFLNLDTYTPKLQSDPNKRKLEKAIMNAFGFSDANIFIENSGANNAVTYSSSMSIDLGSDKLFKSAKKASSKTNGFKFSKEDDVIFMMVLYTGMLVNPEYTDAELTAIILHEIGHNFSPVAERGCKVIYKFPALAVLLRTIADVAGKVAGFAQFGIKTIVDISSIASSIISQLILASNTSKKLMIKIDDLGNKIMVEFENTSPSISKMIGSISTFFNIGKEAMNSAKYVKKYNKLGNMNANSFILNLTTWLVSSLGNPTGYADEKFADSFPRMYGYGPELISGLAKLDTQSNSAVEYIADNYFPLLPAIYGVYNLPFMLAKITFDEHPQKFDRFNFAISDIEKELARTDLDPKTKKKIKQDAIEMKKEYEKYQKSMLKLNKNSAYNLYSAITIKLFGGSLKSKVASRNVNKDIDKFIDELD